MKGKGPCPAGTCGDARYLFLAGLNEGYGNNKIFGNDLKLSIGAEEVCFVRCQE